MHRLFWRALFLLGLGVSGAMGFRTFLYEPAVVESGSMEPTLQVGGHYVVNRWAYRFRDPQRGEIISFISPVDGETRYIKRIIAIPGDDIELRHKRVLVNGEPQTESYTIYTREKENLDGDTIGPLKVPEGMYFVMGDNRDVSYDSTAWRSHATHEHIYFLPRENIKGLVVKI